jgi:hypothetical protein
VTVADAMEKANQAAARIETHEEVCAVRYETIASAQAAQQKALTDFKDEQAKAMKDVRDDNKWIMRWIIATLVAVASGSIGLIFVLITKR